MFIILTSNHYSILCIRKGKFKSFSELRRSDSVVKTVDPLDSAPFEADYRPFNRKQRDVKSSSSSYSSASSPTAVADHSVRMSSSSKHSVVSEKGRRRSKATSWDAHNSSPQVLHRQTAPSPVSTRRDSSPLAEQSISGNKSPTIYRYSRVEKTRPPSSSLKESASYSLSNPFQARLTKAQIAFAALKESQVG